MMFQGRSVISAVWGIVPAAASPQPPAQPVWRVLRLFRRPPMQSSGRAPRLPVPAPRPNGRTDPLA